MTPPNKATKFLAIMNFVFDQIARVGIFLAGSAIVIMTVIFAWLVFGPAPVRTVFVVITDLLMAGFGGMMFWYGLELTKFKWGTLIPLIQWNEGLRSLPLTICGALLLLFSIGHLIRVFLGQDYRKDNIDQG